MEKAQEMNTFRELLKIQTIKRTHFSYDNGHCATLSIHTEKKKKEKKNKQKNIDKESNSKAIQ